MERNYLRDKDRVESTRIVYAVDNKLGVDSSILYLDDASCIA